MGYFAMLVPAYTGHLNPMTALARALQKRGHRTALVTPLDAEAHVRQAGLDFIPVAQLELPRGEWERAAAETGSLSGLKATRCAVRCLARLAQGIQRELPGIYERERFDGLVMDQIALGTEGVCEVLGLPMAVACNSLLLQLEASVPPIGFPWPYRRSLLSYVRNLVGHAAYNLCGWPVVSAVVPYRLRHHLGPMWLNHANLMPPSLVQVTQLPAFLDFPRRYLPSNFHYTGPWIEDLGGETVHFPWERLDGRPLIYASLGTLQNRLQSAYSLIAQACAGLDAQLVLSYGRKDTPQMDAAGNNAVIVGYAPQLALLKHASLVISHGGLNTTLEAISHGLPLVLIPITNDQPGVAARVKRLGVGEFIPIHKLSVARLRRAIETVLSSRSYHEAATKCAQGLTHTNGPARAAELIDMAFTSRRPVYQSW